MTDDITKPEIDEMIVGLDEVVGDHDPSNLPPNIKTEAHDYLVKWAEDVMRRLGAS